MMFSCFSLHCPDTLSSKKLLLSSLSTSLINTSTGFFFASTHYHLSISVFGLLRKVSAGSSQLQDFLLPFDKLTGEGRPREKRFTIGVSFLQGTGVGASPAGH